MSISSRASQAQLALSAYRNGLRATKIAFGRDARMLNAARAQMKAGMHNPPEPSKTSEQQIQDLNDIAAFLRRNVVQGKLSKSGQYHLNIHSETELGDNESIKVTKKTLAARGGGCCGGGKQLYD
ncbi:LAMI_0B06480g1_1 [Lachancea mirantina]|uniref:Mitochondrial zinc maintenance protein 1, mitochondrial n=1 Tax=Lachancea mirantina TaxID=1230905 RepID=A0A1G4IWW9_9SACH|nr:LAMI_0B06480g1_1 [Lachancea mirantina]